MEEMVDSPERFTIEYLSVSALIHATCHLAAFHVTNFCMAPLHSFQDKQDDANWVKKRSEKVAAKADDF